MIKMNNLKKWKEMNQKDKKKIGYNKKSVACFLLLILAITLIVILFNFSITIKKLF
jgi:preprotein translocase subunit SecY